MIHRATRCAGLFSFCILFFIGLVLRAPIVRAAPEPITQADQIKFQQQNAHAQMQEFQERMFRLAESIRETEPDDASRLLMAVKKARQELIIEQMKQALDLLSNRDFTRAADEQAQVIVKLEELKRLLTSSDLDLQMLLEKLRALNQAITKLEAATKEEQRQQNQSDALAKAAAADPKALTSLKQDQQQNRKTTESIAQSVKSLGGAATQAAASLGSASQSMSLAEGALSSGKPSDAQTTQGQAVASMQEAKKKLAEERDKILMELEKMVRKQVVANLTEMLERQKTIRVGTEAIVSRATSSSAERETMVKIKQLGTAETAMVRIAEQTITLIEETNFSVALPPALRQVQQKIAVIAAGLNDSKADARTITSEIEVETDLKDLLDTFKELAATKVTPGSCKGCKGDKNKLVAELKVVRFMQNSVNGQTRNVDAERPKASDLPTDIDPMLKDKILAVRDRQADARDAMQRIHDQLNAPDDPADQAEEEAAQPQ